MSIAEHIVKERFYGAKSHTITEVDIVVEKQVGENTLLIARVNDALYQLLVNEDGQDVLPDHVHDVGESLGTWNSPAPFPPGPYRKLNSEQSNTSLVAGDVMVKYFRKLEPGLNPDVELLSRIPECPHVAPVLGYSAVDLDGDDYTLVMAQQFMPGKDGWAHALSTTSSSFADDARLLGAATASVHTALAEAFGTTVVPASTVADGLITRLDGLIATVPELSQFRQSAVDIYQGLEGEMELQRIHGDLHLGQTLRTKDRYILIDFEGEPARPLADRKLPDSPLRDVAGMIRSIDYAAHFDGVHQRWGAEATAAFLEGYGATDGNQDLLNAYILDKALYEVAYEINNRPDWVHIPLGAVERVLG